MKSKPIAGTQNIVERMKMRSTGFLKKEGKIMYLYYLIDKNTNETLLTTYKEEIANITYDKLTDFGFEIVITKWYDRRMSPTKK